MKQLFTMACLSCVLFSYSCKENKGGQAENIEQKDTLAVKTIKTSEIILDEGFDIINPDSSLFTGVIWSDDGKTFKMIVKDGDPEETFTYHENGKLAISSHNNNMGEEVNAYYDEEGKEMSEDDFMAKYQSVMERRAAVWDTPEDDKDETKEE